MGSSLELFKKYKNDINIFIETGTFTGDGIKRALDAGFNKIYSCDINKDVIARAKTAFSNHNVKLLDQPSNIALKSFLDEINERCVIFLDGHSMPYDENEQNRGFGEDTVLKGLPPCPLLQEIDIISNHHIKNHIILIDDYQCFGTWIFGGITLDMVNNKILKINDRYNTELFGNTICYSLIG